MGLDQIAANDWLTIGAVLLGPILAVQAQKWIERAQGRRLRKEYLFRALVATRGGARLSPEHVGALNMIDVDFYGSRLLGIRIQSRAEKKVIDAWKEYLDCLGEQITDSAGERTREGAFNNLLFEISQCIGYSFDKVHLRRQAYAPQGHIDAEWELRSIRKALSEILQGNAALPIRFAESDSQGLTKVRAYLESIRFHVTATEPDITIEQDSESHISY